MDGLAGASAYPHENGRGLVIPRWQSDDEVSECPICHRSFGFWCRRHHCRRCGRVVCAFCSPHRITIPKAFVVRPPRPTTDQLRQRGLSDVSLTRPTSTTLSTNARVDAGNALVISADDISADLEPSGGEEVRICNPCVPDPNNEPPPQAGRRVGPDPPSRRHRGVYVIDRVDADSGASVERVSHVGYLGNVGNRRSWTGRSARLEDDLSDRPALSRDDMTSIRPRSSRPPSPPHHRLSSVGRRPGLNVGHRQVVSDGGNRAPCYRALPLDSPDHLPAHPRSHHRHHRQRSSSNAIDPTTSGDCSGDEALLVSSAAAAPSNTATASGATTEDDDARERAYCPVCGRRLSRVGSDKSQQAREEHIMACIARYSSPRSMEHHPPAHDHPGSRSSQRSSVPRSTFSDRDVFPVSSSLASPFPPSATVVDNGSRGGVGAGSTLLSSSTTTTPGSVSRARASTSLRAMQKAPRMLVYAATEKDCQPLLTSRSKSKSDDGNHDDARHQNEIEDEEDRRGIECLICLEEFEPGVSLARLECLCKFHESCLRRWWSASARQLHYRHTTAILTSSSSATSSTTAAGLGVGLAAGARPEGCPVHDQGTF